MILEKIKVRPGSIIIMKINQSTAVIPTQKPDNVFSDIASKIMTNLEDELKSKIIIDNGSIGSVTILEAESL